jgi:hypothetical protein
MKNATNEALSALNPAQFAVILHKASVVGEFAAKAHKDKDIMWPCGFAWIVFKIRKNHKHAKALLDAGAYWNDYEKCYQYTPHKFTHSQNMDYKAAILQDVAAYFNDNGLSVYVNSRMD